jgi:hypothetical protein
LNFDHVLTPCSVSARVNGLAKAIANSRLESSRRPRAAFDASARSFAIFIAPFFAIAASASVSKRFTITTLAFTLFQVIVVIRAPGWIAIVSVFLDRTHD